MSDLITRLRALADPDDPRDYVEMRDALREARWAMQSSDYTDASYRFDGIRKTLAALDNE